MAFVEDLSVFFNPEAPGIKPAYWNGGADPVYGELRNEYFDPLGNVVEGSAPVFMAEHGNLPGVKQADTLVIDATTYKVRGVEPDGYGIVLLRLEEQ